MSTRRNELEDGLTQAVEQPQRVDQTQIYQQRKPDIPARKNTIKSTQNLEVVDMGIVVRGTPDESEWAGMGDELFTAEGKLSWKFGDWYNAGSHEWGAYRRFAERYPRSWRTLEDYAYICRNVDLSCRHEKLSLSHHKVVAPLFDESNPEGARQVQRAALDHAFEKGLSVDEFREVVRKIIEGEEEEADTSPALPAKVTGVPIWKKRFDAAETKLFE